MSCYRERRKGCRKRKSVRGVSFSARVMEVKQSSHMSPLPPPSTCGDPLLFFANRKKTCPLLSSNKKLVVTSASLVVTSAQKLVVTSASLVVTRALLVVTKS